MKRFAFSSRAIQISTVALALGALAGCDTLNDYLAPDKVNYKATGSAPPLAVPNDLTAVPLKPQYAAPPTGAGLGTLPQRTMTAAGNATEGAPSVQDPLGMHIERDGDRRWLVVDGRTPDQLWPQLKEFWQDNGFTLKTDAPATGILVTDWAENRANVPDDWFRRTIGKVVDFVYDSGTRDSFRTLVSRTADGNTDISITHSAMEEMMVGPQGGTTSRWEERPRNPVLEAVFLTKLTQKLGLTEAQAKQLLTDARPATTPAQVADTSAGVATLQLAESFDRAWLRVGIALDRTNFTVDNRDREKGLYYVRYADSMQELKRDGLFGKLFYSGPKAAKPGKEFIVNVRGENGGGTQIAVVDANGQVDNSSDAQRIISLLHAQLN
ncbi:outer membrane protein assembly factor BamC [Burkholderia guangdongensis]|uniref:outer membrane protein assembly factor BamC n=1 Tax=Burkholderia guangdongensis TaxID=1792500 RepID=UPI0015CDBCF2|nr:outer membrane protein assembly factor BamC [Burkholderia guangdongensis]